MPKINDEDRDRIVARVMQDLEVMSKARAAVEASNLYGPTGLKEVTDPRLRRQLCLSLAEYFKGTTAAQLDYWESFR